jgi:transposase
MDAPTHPLPDDVETLRAMLRQRDALLARREAVIAELASSNGQLQQQVMGLEHRLDLALRRLYGRLSERIDPRQLLLFGRAMDASPDASPDAAPPTEEGAGDAVGRRVGRGHGRRPLPADLPRHRIEHPLDPQALTCPCCRQPRVRIGEDVSEQLDYTPASLFVLEHVRPKYACRRCEEAGVATADRPGRGQVIEKGLPGPGLVAHVITSKYADHQPLYRLEGMLRRHAPGLELARSTMCGWMKAAADLLAPLVAQMADRIRASRVIHTDDTPVPVQEPGRGQTRTGRLWVYLGEGTFGETGGEGSGGTSGGGSGGGSGGTAGGAYTVFDYTPTRRRDGPMTWLKDFKGYLQADAFGGYDGVYATGAVVEVACWAHARRRFYDARKSDARRSHEALAMIRLLYEVERDARDHQAPARATLRQQRSVPLLTQLHAWLIEQRLEALPKSPMGQAIGYALNHWDALTRYATTAADADGGRLAIDNNAAERAIRPLVVGRKNYLFLGSDTGGRTAATLYSVVASAKRHGLDPFVYLRDVLATIGHTPVSQLDQFLPDRWKQQQLQEIARG